MRLMMLLLAALAMAACNKDVCRWDETDADLIREFSGRELQDVYQAHITLASKCTPPRLTLASALAEFGNDAKSYALTRIRKGDLATFLAATSTISAVNSAHEERCSSADFGRLVAAANNLSVPAKVRATYREQALQACRRDLH